GPRRIERPYAKYDAGARLRILVRDAIDRFDSRRERRKDRRGVRNIAVDPHTAVQARRHRFAMTLEVGGKTEDSAIVVPNDLVNHEATRRLVAWLRRKSRVSRAIEWISLCAFVS